MFFSGNQKVTLEESRKSVVIRRPNSVSVSKRLIESLHERSLKAPRISWRVEVVQLYSRLLESQKISENAVHLSSDFFADTVKGHLLTLTAALLRHSETELRGGALTIIEHLLSQQRRES